MAATGTVCNSEVFSFPAVKKRAVQASFTGGAVTSDGGIALLRQTDRRLGLTKALAQVLADPREPGRIKHPLLALIRQRLYGLAAGYEDLNDHDTLRHDLAWQTAVERDRALASSPTLCRLENRADRQVAWAVHAVLVNQLIASFAPAPAELILDFDTTDDRVHGRQAGAFFHGYYGDYCFLPLYVFCGEQLLVSYLRPGNVGAAHHAWAVLKLLVQRLRQVWPQVKIIVRGDAGFCRWRLLRWCEQHHVHYLVGLAKNARVQALAQGLMEQSAQAFMQTQTKQRHFGEVHYAADTWDKARRVLVKAEHTNQGSNPRFVVTNLEGAAQALYDEGYCARGEMENRIKEQQLGLFADRTRCGGWWANQFRLLLSRCGYVLLERLRALALAGTELARAQAGTIRLKLLKIGAVVLRNTRRVKLLLSSAYPYQRIFAQVFRALGSG
ncbi:MAG: IS1380 family transposase [Verrucomicrobia bacterium]|nr:IS1380 family transposase [Verrucomicrobiota bacterium]